MTVIPIPGAKSMTFEEFLDWKPESKLYELHRGTPIEMQPTGKHEEVIGFLSAELTLATRQLQLPYFIPKQALIKIPDEATSYCPDILLLNRDALSNEPMWEKASTVTQAATISLVVEVVSTNWRDDYGYKLTAYEALGIPEYWIVDYLGLGGVRHIGSPKQPTVSVYSLVEDEYEVQQFRGDAMIQSQVFAELQLTAKQVFRAGF
jgi:Uma2 family endonuclease